MTKEKFLELVDTLFKEVESREDAFLEINRDLSKVLQIGPYRIVIVYAPLSDGMEMTVVRPVKKMTMEEYQLQPELLDLLRNKSKGILISGAPGSGKSTFAGALIDVYHQDHHIIKTIESPRDLMLNDDIVQYSFTYGSHDEVRDILLLSRPDYTIYDEVRNKPDFELYKDLRLTGIGLVGIIHATKPIDSIQRFVGTIEMGIIPQVIDTVIFIDKGQISEVLQLELTAKVPAGMMSEELARPVIVVSSFLQKRPLYEIYTFGEQVMVMPIDTDENGNPKTPTKTQVVSQYAKEGIQRKLAQTLPCDFLIEIKGSELELFIPEYYKGKIIGKGGTAINELEKEI
ncbi:MAG: ATPase, T2SS/T4P/T4SS family [bacterium]|nr:ATPase, T2SS/T4P/T4SS family [bacterium]